MSLTSCASNINGSAFPYNPSAGSTVYRWNLSQCRSYIPKKSTSLFLDYSENYVFGTAYSLNSDQYYPWKYGGMVHLDNPSGSASPDGSGKTIDLNVNNTDNFTFILAWEFKSFNGYGFSSWDVLVGSHDYSRYWCLVHSGSQGQYGLIINGNPYFLGPAPVVGTRYIAVIGHSYATNEGYFYLFDSSGNSNSNLYVSPLQSSTATIALGRFGGFPDTYLSNVFIGDAIYSTTYLSTTDALKIKDSIKYRYGITV